jgi:biopolymer transport protein ExbD
MAFSNNSGGSGAMADMNVTPLVDVMLVLLIIFMVTAPVATYGIQIDLPQKTPPRERPVDPPPPIRLNIDASGALTWDGAPVTLNELDGWMEQQAQLELDKQPLIEIKTHDDAEYQVLATVLAAAKNANLQKIGFVEN